MYKNEYLENCIKENKGSYYLLEGYNYTQNLQVEELVISDLGFIYNRENDLRLFKEELLNAGIKEFILTDNGSGLMAEIHALDKYNIKIFGVTEVKYINWNNKENVKQGLRMKVSE